MTKVTERKFIGDLQFQRVSPDHCGGKLGSWQPVAESLHLQTEHNHKAERAN